MKTMTDLMIGYQFKYGPAWIKFYAGAVYEPQTNFGIIREYSNNLPEVVPIATQEKPLGAAVALQSYWALSDRVWATLNVTWLQPEEAASIYTRAAYEIYRSEGGLKFAAGAEANFSLIEGAGVSDCKVLRGCENNYQGGALLNLRYGANDFSLSGGLSQASDDAGSHAYASTRPYMSISYGRQF